MSTDHRDIFSVSRLNSEIRRVLETRFPLIWVEGEISNLATPRSGHSYFSLKDSHAQVRCALFRNKRQLLRFTPKDGAQVLARARISLYEARGEFQLIIEHMEAAGQGALQREFEALKARLDQEGLFKRSRKQPLPKFPHCLGIVTSATGAALHDILHVIARRYPALRVIVYPTPVQGDNAAAEIRQTLELADARAECDVIILARGGGSLEDLYAFNDEQLARSIAHMQTPIVSAIGHEIDFTIADFVADRRAPTPSAAAELVTPDQKTLLHQLEQQSQRMLRAWNRLWQEKQWRLQQLQQRLQHLHPRQQLLQQQQRLDQLGLRLEQAARHTLAEKRHQLNRQHTRLQLNSPEQRLHLAQIQLDHLQQRLLSGIGNILDHKRQRISELAHALHTVSPLQTLSRGYSITLDTENGRPLLSSDASGPGKRIESRLAKGRLISIVEKVLS